jgi:hypothetical protein
LIRITDEAEAFLILEKYKAADFDFTVAQAKFFRSPKEIIFFLFCPAGVARGAQVFVLGNPPASGELENDLLTAVMNFSGDEAAEATRELALEVIREHLENKSASHYFFDAH